MAKFYGEIGFVETVKTAPGVFTPKLTARNYSGDVIKNSKRWQSGEGVNDNLVVSNEISIIADPFAFDNFQNIVYVQWMGAKWKVTMVEIQRPRIRISLGGVYNAP